MACLRQQCERSHRPGEQQFQLAAEPGSGRLYIDRESLELRRICGSAEGDYNSWWLTNAYANSKSYADAYPDSYSFSDPNSKSNADSDTDAKSNANSHADADSDSKSVAHAEPKRFDNRTRIRNSGQFAGGGEGDFQQRRHAAVYEGMG